MIYEILCEVYCRKTRTPASAEMPEVLAVVAEFVESDASHPEATLSELDLLEGVIREARTLLQAKT